MQLLYSSRDSLYNFFTASAQGTEAATKFDIILIMKGEIHQAWSWKRNLKSCFQLKRRKHYAFFCIHFNSSSNIQRETSSSLNGQPRESWENALLEKKQFKMLLGKVSEKFPCFSVHFCILGSLLVSTYVVIYLLVLHVHYKNPTCSFSVLHFFVLF